MTIAIAVVVTLVVVGLVAAIIIMLRGHNNGPRTVANAPTPAGEIAPVRQSAAIGDPQGATRGRQWYGFGPNGQYGGQTLTWGEQPTQPQPQPQGGVTPGQGTPQMTNLNPPPAQPPTIPPPPSGPFKVGNDKFDWVWDARAKAWKPVKV